MKNKVGSFNFLGLLIVFFLSATAYAEDYIYFKIIEVEKNNVTSEVLFPHRIHFDTKLSDSELVDGLIAEISKNNEALYNNIKVAMNGNRVEIHFVDKLNPDFLKAIGEIYYSLTFNGIKHVIFTDIDGKLISWKSLPYTVFFPVIDYTGAIKPLLFPEMLVHLEGNTYYPRKVYETKIRKNKNLLPSLIKRELIYGNSLIKLYLLQNFDDLPISNKKTALIRLLKDQDKNIRIIAIDKLSYFNDQDVIKALEEVVNTDDDADVKIKAVMVLNSFGIKKYKIFILFSKLKSPNESVVLDTIDQLIKSGDPKVVVGLASVLTHYSKNVREKAAKGIIQLHAYKKMVELLDNKKIDNSIKSMFAKALLNSGKKQEWSRGLIFLLKHGEGEYKILGIKQVGALHAESLAKYVVSALSSDDEDVVKAAIQVLGELKYKPALEKLAELAEKNSAFSKLIEKSVIQIMASMSLSEVMKYANSEKLMLRMFATKSLAEFTKKSSKIHPKIKKILMDRMFDKNIKIKRAAVYALANSNDKTILNKLVKLIDDSDNEIRKEVMIAINKNNYPISEDVIIKKLDDPYDGVKLQAVIAVKKRKIKKALQKLLWMTKYGNIEIKREVWLTIVELMDKNDYKKHFDLFQEALFDQDKIIKITAIEALGQIKDPRVTPALSNLVTDQDPDIQKKALEALSKTKDPAAVEAIVQGLFDQKKEIKMAALEALKKLNLEECRKPVEEFLKNETDKDLRAKAEEVLDSLP